MRANFNSRSERKKPEKSMSNAERLRGFFRRAPKTWTWIERALLASGLALVVIYGAARIESFTASRNAIQNFERASSSSHSGDSDLSQEFSANEERPTLELRDIDFSLWSSKRIEKFKATLGTQPQAPLAVLAIPQIGLEVPVFEGTDDLTLNHGAGRIAGTARPGEPGNIGIAGHRDSFFRGLKELTTGDEIRLRTLGGTDTYVVDEIRVVQPSDVSVLRTRPQPSLTLVTCYPFYYFGSAPQRYIVSASLSEKFTQPAVDVGPRFTNSIQKGESQ